MSPILLSLLLTLTAGAPQQPRDAAGAAATGTSRLSGVVVGDEPSPQPVRRAIVTITGSALRVSRSTITDDSGRFAFDNLPAGCFNVTAARKAYLTSAFGAAYPGGPGTRVSVADAAHVNDVRITLWKGAVLTGVITDASGTPVPSLAVSVFRSTSTRFESAGVDVTDDRGSYRVYGLHPGEYIVAAVPRPTDGGDMGVRSEREVDALLAALERGRPGVMTAARPGEMAPEPAFASPAASRTLSFAPFYCAGSGGHAI